jgi:hypothetical protein
MANPTTNYGFVLPTSTDLVTDLPADFDVALQGVDTRLKALQPGSTLGDLAYSSATANTNTRLGIGSTGQVLTVAGGVPSWSSAGGMTLISTTTLTGASVTLSSISSSYTNLLVVIRNYKPSNDGGNIYFRVNGDNGANRYQINTWTAANGTKTFGADAWILANNNDNSVATGYLQINFPDYANTSTWKVIDGYGYSVDSGTTTSAYYNSFTGAYNQIGAISSMEFIQSGGTFTSGTVLLYGVK